MFRIFLSVIAIFCMVQCKSQVKVKRDSIDLQQREAARVEMSNRLKIQMAPIKVGAERTHLYLPILNGKKVGVVTNQTGMIGKTHLVDSLLSLNVNVTKILSPEHGFRGDADAGEKINSGKDELTGLPIVSLYGNHKKPTLEDLKDVDILIFDIQDVGVRFYTYISTLHYVMEACAENKIQLIVLDRPNPNGHIVDGPVLEPEFKSFVGMHTVPILHGMTIGEYAQMINGEKWLNSKLECALTVVMCENYSHSRPYELPIPPSPNLRTPNAIKLYASLCLLEPTKVSIGRGTEFPFEVYGSPKFPDSLFSFTPISSYGSKNPKLKDIQCYGFDLRNDTQKFENFNLSYLISISNYLKNQSDWIEDASFFDKLAGTRELRKQLAENKSETEIRLSWKPKLDNYKNMRKQYLLYSE